MNDSILLVLYIFVAGALVGYIINEVINDFRRLSNE